MSCRTWQLLWFCSVCSWLCVYSWLTKRNPDFDVWNSGSPWTPWMKLAHIKARLHWVGPGLDFCDPYSFAQVKARKTQWKVWPLGWERVWIFVKVPWRFCATLTQCWYWARDTPRLYGARGKTSLEPYHVRTLGLSGVLKGMLATLLGLFGAPLQWFSVWEIIPPLSPRYAPVLSRGLRLILSH